MYDDGLRNDGRSKSITHSIKDITSNQGCDMIGWCRKTGCPARHLLGHYGKNQTAVQKKMKKMCSLDQGPAALFGVCYLPAGGSWVTGGSWPGAEGAWEAREGAGPGRLVPGPARVRSLGGSEEPAGGGGT